MMSQQIDDGLDKLKKEVNIKISSKFDAGEGNKIKEEIINIKEAIFALQRTR